MHLISYDIEQDALRIKIAKLLIRFGLYRIQYSVFMGDIKKTALLKIEQALEKYLQSDQWSPNDSVMILPLHQYSEDNIQFIGESPNNWSEIIGKIHTLIL